VPSRRNALLSFALSLPDAVEDHPWGEQVAKAGGKVFAFFGPPGGRRVTLKLEESHGHALSLDGAERTGYGLGAHGWVTVPLTAPGVTQALLRDWIEESYRIVVPKRLVRMLDSAGR
jgi:predicted DNA-binding protein (MmcQ/YjbR family)